MCNLYSMTRSREAILRLFRIADNRAGEIKPQSSIFPAYTAPVVRKADDGERELVPMSWGFVLLQPGKAPRRVTNVRNDKVLTSKFWKPSFEARRCIVPASSYCEPNGHWRNWDTPGTCTCSAALSEKRRICHALKIGPAA